MLMSLEAMAGFLESGRSASPPHTVTRGTQWGQVRAWPGAGAPCGSMTDRRLTSLEQHR